MIIYFYLIATRWLHFNVQFIKPIGSLKNFFDQYQRVVSFIVNMNSLLSRLKLREKSPEHTWVVE